MDKNIDSLSPIYRLLDGVAVRLPTRRLSNDDLIRALREKQLKDDAVNNCLPNELTLYEISLLVADDDRVWCRDTLNDAILAGELKAIIDDSNNKITINKVELKKYIDANGFDFSDFPLLNNWFNESDNQADIEQSSAGRTTRLNGYEPRNNDFQAWIKEVSPKHESMIKADIHRALMARDSQLWTSGFPDWWKQQTIYKGTAGRKKKLIK